MKKSFDFDWKFIISDSTTSSSPAFSDSKWSDVQLHHDWNIGMKFDNNKGFFLNGSHVKLQGMCLHQDEGVLDVAVPDRGYERRLQILKEIGCNAIRCSHNQPAPEFLNMCDRMGFLVLDEAFDKWKSGYYKQYFDKWWQHDLSNMLLRDRNHPSIILWSIGNELQEAWEGSD